MGFRRVARFLVNKATPLLSFEQEIFLSKSLMTAQGFGSGGYIESSGETAIFSLVKGREPVLFDVGGHTGDYTEALPKEIEKIS